MFRVVTLLGVFLCLLSGPEAADAKKCPFLPYLIEGTLAVSGTEQDLVGVRVIVFLGDYEYPSAYPPTGDDDDFATPGPSGHFNFKSYLTTTSDNGSCTEVPQVGEAIFFGPGLRTKRVIFRLPSRKRILSEGGASVDLGQIHLRVRHQHKNLEAAAEHPPSMHDR
jgi:hypothetical protein